jgi:plasmid stabilization system protein ParE
MTLRILALAENDLVEGFRFYEAQQPGLGAYFLHNLYGDIESLRLYAGIHRRIWKRYHRLLSKRFPYAIFYTVSDTEIRVHAVLDCRRNPTWLRKQLKRR